MLDWQQIFDNYAFDILVYFQYWTLADDWHQTSHSSHFQYTLFDKKWEIQDFICHFGKFLKLENTVQSSIYGTNMSQDLDFSIYWQKIQYYGMWVFSQFWFTIFWGMKFIVFLNCTTTQHPSRIGDWLTDWLHTLCLYLAAVPSKILIHCSI